MIIAAYEYNDVSLSMMYGMGLRVHYVQVKDQDQDISHLIVFFSNNLPIISSEFNRNRKFIQFLQIILHY